jgi:branched-chain amino acid transport system substrate-binding protein
VYRIERRIAAAIVIAAAMSADGRGRTSAAGDLIVIGVSLPLTGDLSEPGKGIQRGYEAWAKLVNDGVACSAARSC